jgi:hypothetical protein
MPSSLERRRSYENDRYTNDPAYRAAHTRRVYARSRALAELGRRHPAELATLITKHLDAEAPSVDGGKADG